MPVSDMMEGGSKFAKALAVSEAKVGKTVFLAAQALGVFPGQKFGGVVDDPSNLYIVEIDSGGATGVAP
ncbi:MAG: hypothetical protein KGR26_16080, partial [Cyanobacteria bacterium REEB65]|nr:hypothetical protein [Cyanobacteria bacterium REEB65]